MSTMHDQLKQVTGMQDAHSQHNTPLVLEHDRTESTSSGRGKPGVDDLQSSSYGDDDETEVNSELVTIWTQRLQVLTVVTSFLASVDGQLFSLSALNTDIGLPVSVTSREVVYSCLAGALLFHICGAILAYVASFALIRYRIVETSSEDDTKRLSRKIVCEPVHPLHACVTFLQPPAPFRFLSISRSHRSDPPLPLSLLSNCYYTTLALAALGFILALTGILAYIWASLPTSVGIFSTVCLGVGISAAVWAIAL